MHDRWADLVTDSDSVRFRADGEDLAEGQVEELLREMAPALERYGVHCEVDTVEFASDRYEITINGRPCLVWGPPHPWDWLHATVRPLAIVNDLLAEAGAPVRVYTLAAGSNDGQALLLRPEVADALQGESEAPTLVHHGSVADDEARLEAAYAAGAPREYTGPFLVEDATARFVYAGFSLGLLGGLAAAPDGELTDPVAHFLGCDDDPVPDRPHLAAVFGHARAAAADVIRRGESLEPWLDHEAEHPGAHANAAVLAALESADDVEGLAGFIVARFPDRYNMDNFMRYCPYNAWE